MTLPYVKHKRELLVPFPVPHRIMVHEILPCDGGDPALPVALLVHGMTRTSADFDAAAETLAAAGYRCLAPDMPGRGESSALPDPSLYYPGLYLFDLNRIKNEYGLRNVFYVGTSMGGVLGMTCAAMERMIPVRERLIGVMLLNDTGPRIPAEALERVTLAAESAPVFPDLDAAAAHYRRRMEPFGTDPAYVERLFKRALVPHESGGWRYAYDPGVALNVRASARGGVFQEADFRALWAAVDCPVYSFRGERSDVLPPDVAEEMRMHERFAGEYLVQGAGHVPMFETRGQQEALLAMVRGVYVERPAVKQEKPRREEARDHMKTSHEIPA